MDNVANQPDSWKSDKLKSLPIDLIDGDRSSRYPKRDEFQDTGIVFLNTTNIVDNRLDFSGVNYISEEKFAQLRKGKLRPLDIVMTTRGSIGKIAVFNHSAYRTGFINAQMLIIRADGETIDNKFLYYLLCSDVFQERLKNFSSGAAQPQIPIKDLREIEVDYPPLPTQHKIAAVLSAYDDLIENNTRRIQILEEMAQTIYRQWFVEFKYPGHESVPLVESGTELGMIPRGWEVKKVKDIVKRLPAGTRYEQKTISEVGKVPVIDQSRNEVLGFHDNEPNHNASPETPIIIFGDHTCKMQLMVTPFSLGPNVVPFASKDNLPIIYLYFLVHSLVETQEYKRHWNELSSKIVATSQNGLAEQFAKIATPMFEGIELLKQKNANLHETRDLLLPRLVSGEVGVEGVVVRGKGVK